MALRTELTRMLDIRYPLLNAPMTPHAGGALARAVSDAGAFGMIGFDEGETSASIAEQLALLRVGEAPVRFGIGLVRFVLDCRPDLVDLAIAAKPAFVSISFGDPAPYVERFHDAGILVGAQVQSRAWARTALDAGVDVLIAQGTEAGGHTGAVGTLPLLQIVLEMARDIPVIAAGGIATGRGLAAVLAAGAAGAWVGTPFLVAREARSNDTARERLVASDETQTVLTAAFDRVQQKAWPAEFRGRALRNTFTDRFHEREDEITPSARDDFELARSHRDYDVAHLYAGQTVGLVDAVESAKTIVERIVSEAAARLAAMSRTFDDTEPLRANETPQDDELAIDAVTRQFFGAFTNRDGKIPDFDRLRDLFIPEATIVKNVGGTPVVYDVTGFIEPRRAILTDGSLREFVEYETFSRTHIYQNIAQRFSRYAKAWIALGTQMEGRGAKMMHFVRTTGGWKISSVAWDDEAATSPPRV